MPLRIDLLSASRNLQSLSACDASLSLTRSFAGLSLRNGRVSGYQQRRMESSQTQDGNGSEIKKHDNVTPGPGEPPQTGKKDSPITQPKYEKSPSPEEEQGSPIIEMFKRDKDAIKYAPKVLRDQIAEQQQKSNGGSRSYSTAVDPPAGNNFDPAEMDQLIATMMGPQESSKPVEGLKFAMPPTPEYPTGHFRKRYDTVLDQFTKMIMRSGKLAKAERDVNNIIDILRSSPPPRVDPDRPLIYHVPPEQLPLNPVLYLTSVIDSVAPLLRIKQMRGAAGGGMSLPIPVPLNSRQRRRTAIKWILEASQKRRSIDLTRRVAEEIVSVAEGKSSAWQKRDLVHKGAVTARTNINLSGRR